MEYHYERVEVRGRGAINGLRAKMGYPRREPDYQQEHEGEGAGQQCGR